MNFLDDATKQIRTIIDHKNRSYTLISQLLYFCRRDGILRCAVEKMIISKLLREFYEDFYGGHFAERVTTEKTLAAR